MIAALTGRLACKSPSQITLDVQGVGYELFIPLSTFYSLPDIDESASLRVHTHLREDAIQLFGFLTTTEKDAFILLTGISGIGPKLALSVLSTLSVTDLISAIRAGDMEKLATVPGIGKKSAGRIVLELKDKVERLHAMPAATVHVTGDSSSRLHDDALSALVNLGYRAQEAKDIIKRITQSQSSPMPLKDLIRETLKELARG
ncbi:MAG TPA: Holliday junction branch migration protein RuvA [Nitrospiraceae bacterium]|nr:Holliday junction branch migration protein RuvA [Nitrospiraceae bacterium]